MGGDSNRASDFSSRGQLWGNPMVLVLALRSANYETWRRGEDRANCNFEAISNEYKLPFPGSKVPGHRSLRFRFEVEDAGQRTFETNCRG